MTFAFRMVLLALAILAIGLALFAGGCVYIFTNGAPAQLIGVWTVTLVALGMNLAFASLALMKESRGTGMALLVLGPAYAIAAILILWRTGNFHPRDGIGFIWPAFVIKGVVATFTGYRVAWHPRQAGA